MTKHMLFMTNLGGLKDLASRYTVLVKTWIMKYMAATSIT
ncbi:unnamed protein product [Soboliphyme baturini]|uniref:Uncharacterized protein n=1 Tax=Soboliphyme baturini TaxID=241478 RepID=A0A183J872_9BILA|nr:unnamed protein product [Soboliphyme baturini]